MWPVGGDDRVLLKEALCCFLEQKGLTGALLALEAKLRLHAPELL